MPWDADLDPDSAAYAIAATNSPFMRVVSGPGTGKSFALQRRVARLLEEGLDPARLLPVTFTNVAAEDLLRELTRIEVPGALNIRGGTLHSTCMRILSQQAVLESIGRIPRPLNQYEMEPLLQDLPIRHGNKRARSQQIRAYEAAWARLQNEEPGYALSEEDQAFHGDLISWLAFHRGMLIGEIIPYAYQYLKNNPAAPERSLYDHVLVDEYQDLNRAEQGVIDFLSGAANICVVGDDDQSLYSFKFAHPAGIREYHLNHLGTVDHAITICRRCPTTLVAMANALIAHNADREPRVLVRHPENGPGQVQIVQYDTLDAEVVGIRAFIQGLLQAGYQPHEILVLAQRRAIGNPIHVALTGVNIPAKSYYQEGILDSEAAQERLAILKLIVDRSDRIALRWLLGFGSTDFRRASYARLREYCEANAAEPWDALSQLSSGELQLRHLHGLVQRFKEVRDEIEQLEQMGEMKDFLLAWLKGYIDDDDPFQRLAADVGLSADTPDALLELIVDAVSTPEVPPDIQEVRIMSLHKSKGLSAPVVIVAGCIEGLLPAAPDPAWTAAQSQAALEEQRRLLFVGITRVKSRPNENRPGLLLLTSSRFLPLKDAMQSGIKPARVSYGTAQVHASRFLQELGPSAPAPVAG